MDGCEESDNRDRKMGRMAAHEIRNGADLTDYLRGQSEDIAQLRGAVMTTIGDELNGRSSGGIAHNPAWEKLLRAVLAKSHSQTLDAGARACPTKWEIAEKADLGSPLYSDATTGSYLVPQGFALELMRVVGEVSTMYPLVKRMKMTTRTLLIPTEATAATMAWLTAESAGASEVLPTFGQKTLTAKVLAGWIAFTESLIEDSGVSILKAFSEQFVDDLATRLDLAILGDGAGGSSPWTGILDDTTVDAAAVHMGAGDTTWANLDLDDMFDMIEGLTTAKYRRGATIVTGVTQADKLRRLKDAMGSYVWRDSLATGMPPTFAGYAVRITDSWPADGANKPVAIIGNFERGFVLGERIGLAIQLFDQSSYRASYEEQFLRARSRWAGVVTIPECFSLLKTAAG